MRDPTSRDEMPADNPRLIALAIEEVVDAALQSRAVRLQTVRSRRARVVTAAA